jgi:hypothetical protein
MREQARRSDDPLGGVAACAGQRPPESIPSTKRKSAQTASIG